MPTMRIPATFRFLPASALAAAKSVSADKVMTLAGNGGWLYEGLLDRPVPGHVLRSNRQSFDHAGAGRGRPLPVIHNLRRPLFRAPPDFAGPLSVMGDGREQAVLGALPDFHSGDAPPEGMGWNWRRVPGVPFAPHLYARVLRARVRARRSAGSVPARLFPALYADPDGLELLGAGEPQSVENENFTRLELTLHLDGLDRSRGVRPLELWYWGLRVYAPLGCTVEIDDGDGCGPCLAVCSL